MVPDDASKQVADYVGVLRFSASSVSPILRLAIAVFPLCKLPCKNNLCHVAASSLAGTAALIHGLVHDLIPGIAPAESLYVRCRISGLPFDACVVHLNHKEKISPCNS
jgi:hypothetical protein